MTDRITVSAASGKDAPAMPSWVSDDQVTYAQAGVDTAEGARAVDAIKESSSRARPWPKSYRASPKAAARRAARSSAGKWPSIPA